MPNKGIQPAAARESLHITRAAPASGERERYASFRTCVYMGRNLTHFGLRHRGARSGASMLRDLLTILVILLVGIGGANAATNAAIDNLEAEVLAKFKGTAPATIIQVLGAPNASTERDGKEYLTWESAKSSGAYVYGVGVSESYSCKATFEFLEGALAKVRLFGAAGSDRSLCKMLMKPLLRNSTPPGSVGNVGTSDVRVVPPSATPLILTNADVVKLTAAGLPDSVILTKINGSSCNFDLSTDALVALKQAGVRDPIIEAMMAIAAKR